MSAEHKLKIGNALRGRRQPDELKKRWSEIRKSLKIKPWNKGVKNCYSPECLERIRQGMVGKKLSEEHKRHLSLALKGRKFPGGYGRQISERQRGPNNPNWRGGVSSAAELIRKSKEYDDWRKQVLLRDKYTCVLCGLSNGVWLKDRKMKVRVHVDHIKQFALYPELRLAIDNGRTLCLQCHTGTDTYGFKRTQTER